MLTPSPGTIDLAEWEGSESVPPFALRATVGKRAAVNGVPLSRYWLIPSAERPKVYSPHPVMSADDIRRRTQEVWDRFCPLAAIWQRSDSVRSIRSRIAFVLISKLYRQNRLAIGVVT